MADTLDVDPRRRDLYAMSIALLIFNLAGGLLPSATDSTPTMLGSIHITRPLVLLFGAWIMWAYFLWRFWLTARPILGAFFDDIDLQITSSRAHREHSHKLLMHIASVAEDSKLNPSKHDFPPTRTDTLERISRVAMNIVNNNLAFAVVPRTARKAIDFKRAIDVSGKSGMDFPVDQIPVAALKRIVDEVPWDKKRIIRRAFWRAVIRDHAFGDRILPIIVAFTALAVQIARLLWTHYLTFWNSLG
jgi:hypothetical protein